MRTDTEEIIYKLLEAKGGLTVVVANKHKTKAERYAEELKEVDDKFILSQIIKATKKNFT
jgi:glutathione synthase/RimK-type ligase-like ATP-grasp enzyme